MGISKNVWHRRCVSGKLGDGRVRIVTHIANPNGGCVPQIKYEGIPRYPTVEDYKGSGGSFPNIRIARQIKYVGQPEKKEDKSKPKPNSGSGPAYVPKYV